MNTRSTRMNVKRREHRKRSLKGTIKNSYAEQHNNYRLMLQLYSITKKEETVGKQLTSGIVAIAGKDKVKTRVIPSLFARIKNTIDHLLLSVVPQPVTMNE